MDSAAERQKPNLRPKPLLSGIPKLPTLVSIPIARSRLLPHHLLYRFHRVPANRFINCCWRGPPGCNRRRSLLPQSEIYRYSQA
jgi:hypothetical protein